MTEEEKNERIKDLQCVGCKYVIDSKCKGHPRKVIRCNNFEERKKDEQA